MNHRFLSVAVLLSLCLAFGCTPKLHGPVLAPQGELNADYTSEVEGEQVFPEVGRLFGVSISGNGQYLLLHRFDGDFVLEPASRWTSALPKTFVRAVLSPDNECVAVAVADGVKILKLRGQELVREWGSTEEPRRIDFSPDGNLIAITTDKSIRVLNVGDGKSVFEKKVKNAFVVFSPDSRKLVVRIRNNITDSPVEAHPIDTVLSMSYWMADATVGVVDDDEFFLFDLERGQMVMEHTAADGVVLAVTPSPDGRLLAVAKVNDWETSAGGTIEIYDTASGMKIHSWDSVQSLTGISFSPTSEDITAYSPLAEGGLITYSLQTGKQKRHLTSDNTAMIMDVEYSPDGRLMAVAVSHTVRGQGAVILYDTDKECVLYSRILDEPIYEVAFFPGGEAIAVAAYGGVRTIPLTDFVGKTAAAVQ